MHNDKYRKKWLLCALVCLSIAVNLYFRLNTLFLPYVKKAVARETYADIRAGIDKEISFSSPRVSGDEKRRLKENSFKAYLKENKSQIGESIDRKSREIKDYFQDERGWTYLLETDSFRWARRIENYLNTGHFGTAYRDKQEYDDLEFARKGDKVESISLFFYLGAYIHKFLHSIDNNLSLMNSLGLIPVILSPFLVIAVFYLCGLFGISCFGSFLASIIFCLSPVVLERSSYGWFDTDIFNLLLPLIIAFILARSFVKKSLYSRFLILLSGLLFGIYSSFWSMWWIFLYFFLAGILLYKLCVIFYDKKQALSIKVKDSLFEIFLLVSSAYLSVFLISGLDVLKDSWRDPLLYFTVRQGVALDNFWPGSAFSVFELKRSEISDLVNFSGGSFILYGGIAGILPLITHKKLLRDFREKNFIFVLLLVWLLSAAFLTHFGTRFILFLILPLAVFFSYFWDILCGFMLERKYIFVRLRKINRRIYNSFVGCIFLSLVAIPVNNSLKLELSPLMNDSWTQILEEIKEITPAEAVINANWPEGDLIMTGARRATIQDAHWQHNAISYWFNNAILTDNENEALGIMRMVDSGGNRAFEKLSGLLNGDKYISLGIIKEMLSLRKEEGAVFLSKYIKDKESLNEIIGLIYPVPPPAYLIVHDLLLGSMPMLSRIANWDFERYLLWSKSRELEKDKFIVYAGEKTGYSGRDFGKLYSELKSMKEEDVFNWVTADNYAFGTSYSARDSYNGNNDIVRFANGLTVDKNRMEAYLERGDFGKKIILDRVIFFADGGFKENMNKGGDGKYSVFLSEDEGIYKAVLFDSPLYSSLFFKLYFMQGRGVDRFKLISRKSKKGFSDIYLYKIEWN